MRDCEWWSWWEMGCESEFSGLGLCGGEGGQRTGSKRDRARWIEDRRVVWDDIGSSEDRGVSRGGVEEGRRGLKNTGVYRDDIK